MLSEIIDLADFFSADEDTRAIILTGTGKNFSVGIDLADPELIKRLTRGSMHMDSDQFQLAISSQDFSEGLQAFREKRKPEFKGN